MHKTPKAQTAPDQPSRHCAQCKAQTRSAAEQTCLCSAASSPAQNPVPLTRETAQHGFLEPVRTRLHGGAQSDLEAETQEPECAPVSDPSEDAENTLPPPHPALAELVRILARTDARQAREKERRPQ